MRLIRLARLRAALPGVAFPVRHAHEHFHVAPLQRRLGDVPGRGRPSVVVWPDTRPPVRGAWNVQVFHGLGDKAYTTNPLFLQRGRAPRVRTALNVLARTVRSRANFLRPPLASGRRRSRYEQVNAYGKRWEDLFSSFLVDVALTRFGHVALNERELRGPQPGGRLLWLPTWDNRKYLGGPNQSSLDSFAPAVARLARDHAVEVKYHPLTIDHDQGREARRLVERAGARIKAGGTDPYDMLSRARGVLTDSSSLGFEAFACGIPVAILRPPGVTSSGLHAELDARVDVFAPDDDLAGWAAQPPAPRDRAWREDILAPPMRKRNDEFAAQLRGIAEA